MENMKNIYILVPLLLLLPPVCGGLLGLTTENFIHYDDRKSWQDALDYCREQNSNLVIIEDEEVNQDFLGVWGSSSTKKQGWIGLYRNDSGQWKWSRGDMVATFFSWDNDEPKDGQNCAVKYPDNKKWKTNYCEVQHSFMCYNEPLVLVKEKKTWEEALKHCRSLEPVDPSRPATAYQNYRYDLATLLTQEDHDIARKKAQRATTAEVWTGLHYLAGHWVWVGGGGDVQYNNTEGCPTQRFCGVLLKTGSTLFDTRDCGESKNFLCYRKP